MGLNTKDENNGKQIVVIKHGGLCLESKEPKEGFVEKEVDIPNTDRGDGQPNTMTKYIKTFRSLDGMVQGLEWYNTEDKYTQTYLGVKIHMKDGDEEFLLDIPYTRRIFNTFCKFAENINWTEPVEFWTGTDDKGNVTFGASQDGAGVKHRYTMANPGPMPKGKQNRTTKKWDFSEQNEWLLNNMLDNVIPTVNAQLGFSPEQKAAAAAASAGEDRWADVKDAIHDDED